MFQHGTADDLPGVLPVGQHDALVHDDALRGLRGCLPGHADDVEVRRLVGVRGARGGGGGGLVRGVRLAGRGVDQAGVQGGGGEGAGAGQPGPHAVVQTTRHRELPHVRNFLFLDGPIRLAQHRGGGGAAARHRARYRVVFPVVDDGSDPPLEAGLLPVIGAAGAGVGGLDLAGQLVSLVLVHNEH